MSERTVHLSKSKARRTLQKIYEEACPQFLIDNEWEVPEELVDKVVRGARAVNHNDKREGVSRRAPERSGLPYIPATGVSVTEALRLADEFQYSEPPEYDDPNRSLYVWGMNEDCFQYQFNLLGFTVLADYKNKKWILYTEEEPEVPRYSRKQVTFGGSRKCLVPESRERSKRINESIDTKLARGKNPFRPERSWEHSRYG
ncbi:MAG: hypothetical protein KKB79_02970 [Nanoarchaeota archaeon]|nr:hypothetical protein [Nanoarchaeota archaeon]